MQDIDKSTYQSIQNTNQSANETREAVPIQKMLQMGEPTLLKEQDLAETIGKWLQD